MTVLYVIFCTYILTLGSKESNLFNYVFTIGKLVTLGFITLMAFTYFKSENLQPFFLEERGGFQGTIEGATIVFFAFLGFDFITCLAEESRNPRKDLPKSIQLTIGLCSVLYCLIALSLAGMAKLHTLPGETAMAHAFATVGSEWMSYIIYISAFLGISASAFTQLMS